MPSTIDELGRVTSFNRGRRRMFGITAPMKVIGFRWNINILIRRRSTPEHDTT